MNQYDVLGLIMSSGDQGGRKPHSIQPSIHAALVTALYCRERIECRRFNASTARVGSYQKKLSIKAHTSGGAYKHERQKLKEGTRTGGDQGDRGRGSFSRYERPKYKADGTWDHVENITIAIADNISSTSFQEQSEYVPTIFRILFREQPNNSKHLVITKINLFTQNYLFRSNI